MIGTIQGVLLTVVLGGLAVISLAVMVFFLKFVVEEVLDLIDYRRDRRKGPR